MPRSAKSPKFIEFQRPLHFPPPQRVWVRQPDGLWSSRPWAKGEKEAYIKANMVTVRVEVA